MITCPKCNGAGWVRVFVEYRRSGELKKHKCSMCSGTGGIKEDRLDWIRRGRRIRERRIERGETLRKWAERLGITPTELSAAESGRVDPTPYEDMKE